MFALAISIRTFKRDWRERDERGKSATRLDRIDSNEQKMWGRRVSGRREEEDGQFSLCQDSTRLTRLRNLGLEVVGELARLHDCNSRDDMVELGTRNLALLLAAQLVVVFLCDRRRQRGSVLDRVFRDSHVRGIILRRQEGRVRVSFELGRGPCGGRSCVCCHLVHA